MPLQTRSDPQGSRFYLAALEPPGNIAREIALYRRRLFSELGDASALAFPEILPLAIGMRPSEAPLPLKGRALERFLDAAWKGAAGPFRLGRPALLDGLIYLQTEGPLEVLAAAALRLMGGAGFRSETRLPVRCAFGIFLCRPPKSSTAGASPSAAEALSVALSLKPPALSFGDASLLFMRFESGSDPFAALTWKELGRSRRLSGRPARPRRGATP
ncbi:MAG: hypothetical protein ACLQMF_11310 [Rectinemataceae bacterium]